MQQHQNNEIPMCTWSTYLYKRSQSVKYFKAFKIGNGMIDQACRIVMQIGILSKIITDDLTLYTTMLSIKVIKVIKF